MEAPMIEGTLGVASLSGVSGIFLGFVRSYLESKSKLAMMEKQITLEAVKAAPELERARSNSSLKVGRRAILFSILGLYLFIRIYAVVTAQPLLVYYPETTGATNFLFGLFSSEAETVWKSLIVSPLSILPLDAVLWPSIIGFYFGSWRS